MKVKRWLLILLVAAVATGVLTATPVQAQSPKNPILEEELPPGKNFEKANFRLWLPENFKLFRGVVLLMPGSNGDARQQVDDPVWQQFATKHGFALLGAQITDKPHEQDFLEQYVNVSEGSGQAVLDALAKLATRSQHPELTNAPLLLWGMSAGGQFSYEFTAWKPDRVIAFVVNKAGIYYTALVSKAARNVPGILFIGGKEPVPARNTTIKGLFALNRRAGALWALAEEPNAGHVVGRSRDVALVLFEDAVKLRLGEKSDLQIPAPLKQIPEASGFVGDFSTGTFHQASESADSQTPYPWLLTERVAKSWAAMVTEKPFEP